MTIQYIMKNSSTLREEDRKIEAHLVLLEDLRYLDSRYILGSEWKEQWWFGQ